MQRWIAESRVELEQARLLTLSLRMAARPAGHHGAWRDVSLIKVAVPAMLQRIADRAMQVFGAMGGSDDTPIHQALAWGRLLRIGDGPDEVHLRQIFRMEAMPALVDRGLALSRGASIVNKGSKPPNVKLHSKREHGDMTHAVTSEGLKGSSRRRLVSRSKRRCCGRCRFPIRAISTTPRAASSARCENARITYAQGRAVWSLEPYGFLSDEKAPPTVNPSLWRQSRLNMNHGLFEVVPGVYQVRGLDIANMTLIEGERGVIVVDTLTSIEGARAAMELYFQHRGRRPVTAVIFTHTHTDHWGGARGVLDDETLASGRVPIIAPDLFMEHAVSENIIAGPAMLRRAQYQFGPFLAKGAARPGRLRARQVDGGGLGGAVAADRPDHGDRRQAHHRRRWNSNSRWRRTAKRRRKCISSSRATSC